MHNGSEVRSRQMYDLPPSVFFLPFLCQGLAGLPSHISDIFLQYNIDGIALSLLLREDFLRMGITKLDHQLILMKSIDLLLTLV